MPDVRMDAQRKLETEAERSRRLREKADEANDRLGEVMQELIQAEAARGHRLATEAAELRARMRGYSPAPQAADRPPLGGSDEVGARSVPPRDELSRASPDSPMV
jgi:hypothetical protein